MRDDRGRISCLGLLIVVAVVALIAFGVIGFRSLDRATPVVKLAGEPKAIGRKTSLTIEASEPKHGIRSLRAVLVQEGRERTVAEITNPHRSWLGFAGSHAPPTARVEVELGRERIPDLKEGNVTLRVWATNDSPARFGKGRTAMLETTLPVLLTPPRLEVLSSIHYIRQAGSECVTYRVSESADVSGVRVGGHFFQGFPLPGGSPGERFAFFAFPYDVAASTAPLVVARDAADNEKVASINYKLFPRNFRNATIELTDEFLQRVVPPILSETPSIQSQGDLLKDFLQINGALRRGNAAELAELASRSRPEFLWHGAFTQLGGSQVMASFADRRSYDYKGRIVDHQDHLGYDLAVTSSHPVDASNDGVVALARFFGIYGNTVVIDHGFGLMTLYAHLSSIDVKEGQPVRRGEVVGKSGATGLAGGDHLHFSVLIQGVPVDPTEWWDPHWIHDRIESKIGPRDGSHPPTAP